MTPTVVFHTALGVLALATGASVLLGHKGDRWHRWVGRVYAVAMIVLCVARSVSATRRHSS